MVVLYILFMNTYFQCFCFQLLNRSIALLPFDEAVDMGKKQLYPNSITKINLLVITPRFQLMTLLIKKKNQFVQIWLPSHITSNHPLPIDDTTQRKKMALSKSSRLVPLLLVTHFQSMMPLEKKMVIPKMVALSFYFQLHPPYSNPVDQSFHVHHV